MGFGARHTAAVVHLFAAALPSYGGGECVLRQALGCRVGRGAKGGTCASW